MREGGGEGDKRRNYMHWYFCKFSVVQENVELEEFLPEQSSETLASLDIHTKPNIDKEPGTQPIWSIKQLNDLFIE